MWNDKKSLFLSKCCTVLFMILLILASLPITWYLKVLTTVYFPSLRGSETAFLLTVYPGAAVAAVLLMRLFMLLHRIGKGEVFVRKNTECLRHISWCCFVGALIAAAGSLYWTPWLVAAVSAAFAGLIMRVIKNVFAKAVDLQDDAEFTI